MSQILLFLSSVAKILLGILGLLAFVLFILLQNRRADDLWALVLPVMLLLLLLFGSWLYRRAGGPALLHGLFIPEWRFKTIKRIGLLVVFGLVVRACAYSEYAWKEEVLLHDGSKIMVERTTVDWMLARSDVSRERLVKRTLRFRIRGMYQWASWVTTYSYDGGDSTEDLGLEVISLDFLDGVPYVATVTNNCMAYKHLGSPNPPYFFFKYVDYLSGWQRIPLAEFPLPFKVNIVSDMEWRDVRMDKKRYGVLQSETVAHEIQRKLEEIAMRVYKLDSAKLYKRRQRYYSIIRTPFKPEDLVCEEVK